MPRSFHLTAESPHRAERILGTFGDERYWRARLAEFDDGRPALDSLAIEAGVTTARITLRFGVEQLPSPLNRLLHGSVRVVHVERWCGADDHGVVRGRITVDAPGTPMSGHGDLSVTPVDGGSRLAGTGTVDVRLPVVGGAIAGMVAGQLAGGIRDIHRFTDAWITEADRP